VRNYECVGCGKKMDGGTFLCLTAWCAPCYERVGKEAIIAAADAVEGVVNAYRSALLAKKFRPAPSPGSTAEPAPEAPTSHGHASWCDLKSRKETLGVLRCTCGWEELRRAPEEPTRGAECPHLSRDMTGRCFDCGTGKAKEGGR